MGVARPTELATPIFFCAKRGTGSTQKMGLKTLSKQVCHHYLADFFFHASAHFFFLLAADILRDTVVFFWCSCGGYKIFKAQFRQLSQPTRGRRIFVVRSQKVESQCKKSKVFQPNKKHSNSSSSSRSSVKNRKKRTKVSCQNQFVFLIGFCNFSIFLLIFFLIIYDDVLFFSSSLIFCVLFLLMIKELDERPLSSRS